MYRKPIASIAVVITLLAAMPAMAIEAGQYASDAGTKLGRGVLNAVTGWVEVPKQTVIGGREDGVLGGFGGFFKGVAFGVARTLAGAFEIATFWSPVPERFEPVMQPATVFGNGSPPRTAGEKTTGSARAARRAAASSLKDIFFEDDSAALRQDARKILLANAEWLRVNPHFVVSQALEPRESTLIGEES